MPLDIFWICKKDAEILDFVVGLQKKSFLFEFATGHLLESTYIQRLQSFMDLSEDCPGWLLLTKTNEVGTPWGRAYRLIDQISANRVVEITSRGSQQHFES